MENENQNHTTDDDDSPPSIFDIENARKAATSSPNSLELSHSYASLLYEAAEEPEDYELIAQECERALAIQNPVDDNIDHLHNEIRRLVQCSNLASLAIWMDTYGTGKELFTLIPTKKKKKKKNVEKTNKNEMNSSGNVETAERVSKL